MGEIALMLHAIYKTEMFICCTTLLNETRSVGLVEKVVVVLEMTDTTASLSYCIGVSLADLPALFVWRLQDMAHSLWDEARKSITIVQGSI